MTRSATPRRTRRSRAATPATPARKRDATRQRLLDAALALFQENGVEGTTMRDIAEAAGMALGAAYYYFPSKEALVFAYYEANQDAIEKLETAGTLRERLGALLHAKLDSIRDQRHMLGTILPRLVNPGDPLSAFSAQTRAVRERAVAVFARPLRDAGLPAETVTLAANALWMFQLALMLVYLHDTSPRQKRSHGLVDDGLDLVVPMLPLLATPMGKAVVDRVIGALDRAGIAMV